MSYFPENTVSIQLSGSQYSGSKIRCDITDFPTVGKVKEYVADLFGLPPKDLRMIAAGRIWDDDTVMLNSIHSGLLSLISSSNGSKTLQSPHELLCEKLISFLEYDHDSENISFFLAQYEEALMLYQKQMKTFERISIPVPTEDLLKKFNAISPKKSEKALLIKDCIESDSLTKIYQNCIDRALQSDHISPLSHLGFDHIMASHLKHSTRFQTLLKQEHSRRNLFPDPISTKSLEAYADARSLRTKCRAAQIRLFHIERAQLLPLINQAIADQQKFGPQRPLRIQLLVSAGHTTCLDLKIQGNYRSCVILDSISEISDKNEIKTLIENFGFTVYLASSTIPNRKHYQISISKTEPPLREDQDRRPVYDCHLFQKCSDWYFRCNKDLSVKVEDKALLAKLNTVDQDLPLKFTGESNWLDLLLQSELPIPFATIQMQKDTSSCLYFSLHYAIRSGKLSNLHELCDRLAKKTKQPEPFTHPWTGLGPLSNPVRYILWKDLPPEFIQWSQSETFLGKKPRDESIQNGMERKIGKYVGTSIPEMKTARFERLRNFSKLPNSSDQKLFSIGNLLQRLLPGECFAKS